MPRFIAFLRAVNVGGHNRMKMAELRTALEERGFDAVETYIQSGNVRFDADEADERMLRGEVHDAIEAAFGHDVSVMIRTPAALAEVVAGQPFDVPGPDGVRHYVTFLHEAPIDERVEKLLDAGNRAESFAVAGRDVYTELDKNALGDERTTDVGRTLGMAATRRHWDVVTAVLELSETQ